jgi:hypothetical protein
VGLLALPMCCDHLCRMLALGLPSDALQERHEAAPASLFPVWIGTGKALCAFPGDRGRPLHDTFPIVVPDGVLEGRID